MDMIRRQSQIVLNLLNGTGIDPEIKQEANAAVGEIREDLVQLESESGYQDHLLDVIQRERTKYRANTPDDHAYDGDREAPLCTCDSRYCALKQGKLPTTVRRAASIDEGIREHKQDHNGNPFVLEDAQREWREKHARVRHTLSQAIVAMRDGVSMAEATTEGHHVVAD